MKYLIGLLIVFVSVTDPVTKIAKSNKLKRTAKMAYESGDLALAVESYKLLIDSLQVEDDNARLNLANAAYLLSYGGNNMGLLSDISSGKTQVQDSSQLQAISGDLQYFDIADKNYRTVTSSNEKSLASSAHNQSGIISYKMSEQSPDEKESFIQTSLGNFKSALLKNPYNDQARYNYELLKKIIRQQQEQEQENQDQQDQQQQDQQENQDQEQQNQEQQEQQEQDQENQEKQEQQQNEEQEQKQEQQQQEQQEQEQQEEGEQKEDPMEKLMEKLKEMNIPLEKAQMILEAMKNNEIQYVQQKKRKAEKQKDSSKPDW